MTRRLATLQHDDDLDLDGSVVERRAVRAVVRRGRDVLLLKATDGSLKFPGGGVEPGENDMEALRRELDEECGLALAEVLADMGEVLEVARPEEPGFDVFRMTSRYIECTVAPGSGRQLLSDHEQSLGLTPVWVDPDRAVLANEAALGEGQRWVHRELLVLRLLSTAVRGGVSLDSPAETQHRDNGSRAEAR